MRYKKLATWAATTQDKKEDYWQLYYIQLVLLTTVLRLIFAMFAEVKYEEAYYWCYAANLDWSYFDHPPMVGWLIHLFSQMGGQLELVVRIPAILLFAITLTLIFRLTTRMFNSKVGFYTCAIVSCLPTFEWYSMLIMPDAPLMACWALGLYWSYRLVTEERASFWWVIGLATGLGMLSKYPAVLIPLAPAIYLIWNRRWKVLFNVHMVGAAALAIALFYPVIMWNAQHDWCSFIFQGVSRFSEATSFLNRFGGTWLNQVLVLSPGGLILIIWTLVVSWRRREEPAVRLLICASYPFLLLMLAVSCLRLVQMNWPLPGYIAAAILAGSEIERRDLLHRRKWVMGLIFIPAIAISALPLIGTMLPLGSLNRANELKGWKDMGKVVMEHLVSLPNAENAFIVGNGYQIASETAFYTQRPDITFCTNAIGAPERSKGFTYWRDPNEFVGQDAVIITYDELRSNGEWRERQPFNLQEYKAHFESVANGENMTVFYGGKPLRRYRIYLGHNYLGTQPQHPAHPTSGSDFEKTMDANNPLLVNPASTAESSATQTAPGSSEATSPATDSGTSTATTATTAKPAASTDAAADATTAMASGASTAATAATAQPADATAATAATGTATDAGTTTATTAPTASDTP